MPLSEVFVCLSSRPYVKITILLCIPFIIQTVTSQRCRSSVCWSGAQISRVRIVLCVTVDESIREEDGSDNEENNEDEKDVVCQLLNQGTASQRRDKSCAPSH